jgi:hypothetical protein
MISAAVQKRRQQEFDQARTRAEVDQLLERWQSEDDAAARAQDWRTRQVVEHGRRLDRLERALFNANGDLSDTLVDVFAKVLARERKGFEQKLTEIERQIPKFHGVHEAGRTYEPHSLVVKGGGLWISLIKTTRPPGCEDWQLCTKSGEVR